MFRTPINLGRRRFAPRLRRPFTYMTAGVDAMVRAKLWRACRKGSVGQRVTELLCRVKFGNVGVFGVWGRRRSGGRRPATPGRRGSGFRAEGSGSTVRHSGFRGRGARMGGTEFRDVAGRQLFLYRLRRRSSRPMTAQATCASRAHGAPYRCTTGSRREPPASGGRAARRTRRPPLRRRLIGDCA